MYLKRRHVHKIMYIIDPAQSKELRQSQYNKYSCYVLAEAVLDPPVTKAVSLRLHDSNYRTCVALTDVDHYTFLASQHRWVPEPPSTCWMPGLTISMGELENNKTSFTVSITGRHLACSTSHFEVALQEKQWSTCGLAGTYETCTWEPLYKR